MAYKVSYKVVTEQGEQLKNIAKEMDNYVSRVNQIVSKLGSDELLQQVRGDLNKFKQQLEEEKTVLNLAGQVITDVVQNYSGTEKKSVGKVDKAKAHNRDFYKRPVSVASAGGAVAAGAAASASSVSIGSISNSSTISNTTNVFGGGMAGAGSAAGSAAAKVVSGAAKEVASKGSMAAGIVAAVGSVAAAGGAIAGVDALDKKKAKKN